MPAPPRPTLRAPVAAPRATLARLVVVHPPVVAAAVVAVEAVLDVADAL